MTCSPRSWQHLLSVFPEGVIRPDLFMSPPLRCLCLPSLCLWGQNHGRDGPGPGPGPGGKGWEEVGNWGGRPGRRKPGDGDVTGSWQNPEGLGFPGMARGGLLGKRRLLAMTAIQQAREMAASRDLGGVGKHAVGRLRAQAVSLPGSTWLCCPGSRGHSLSWLRESSRGGSLSPGVGACGSQLSFSRATRAWLPSSPVPKAQPSLWHPGTH